MAIYHLHVGIVKRSSGRSSVAAAAYRAAEKLRSDYDGVTHDYSHENTSKSSAVNAAAYRSGESLRDEQHSAVHDYRRKYGVVRTEIMLPETAPREYQDRATLWNAVEKSEKRKDAQTARDIDMALPVELDRQEQIELVRGYVKENFVEKGMCADFSIHDKGDGNPHAHVMLTTREVNAAGFGKKNRDWNAKGNLKSWRESWAVACNEQLQAKGFDKRIDHRTLEAQGIDREPTIHVGVSVKHMERKGIEPDRTRVNQGIIARNTARNMHELKENYISLDKEISSSQETAAEARREANALRIKAEEITERAGNIQSMRERLDELKSGRHNGQQAQQLERSENQATSYFQRTYKFEPEQAAEEVAKLGTAFDSKKHLYDKLQEKITPLTEEREAFLLEYQRHKLLADISPNREAIQNYLNKLEKENQAHRKSVQDDLARLRCQRTLATVTEHSFQRILDDVTPEQAYKLIKQRDRERELDRIKAFQHGR